MGCGMIPVRWAVPHLCDLPKLKRDKKVLLMFRGFFDESNRNPSDLQFVMSGWTARVEEWEKFSEDWQRCLSQKPSIKYFKSYEANSLSDEFYRFSVADAKAKQLALAKVISNHGVRGYIATAKHDILSGRPKKLRKSMGTRIYDWAFIAMVSTVLIDFLERGERSEKIDFIFDDCKELRACIESCELIMAKFPPSMQKIAGKIIPGDDRELVGLQAADLLAGEHSAYLRTGTKDIPYSELINADVPIREFPAGPPQAMIKELIQYAQGVYEREELVSVLLKSLKAKGVTLADLKKLGL